MFIYWKGSEAAGDRLPWGAGIVVVIIIINNILFFQRGPSHPPPQPPPFERTLTVSWTEPQSTSFLSPPRLPRGSPSSSLLIASSLRLNGQTGGSGVHGTTQVVVAVVKKKKRQQQQQAPARFSGCQMCVSLFFFRLIGDNLCLSGWDPCQARGRGSIWQKWRWERNSVFYFASHLPSRFRLCVSLRFYMKLMKYETFVFPFYIDSCEGPTNTKFLLAI